MSATEKTKEETKSVVSVKKHITDQVLAKITAFEQAGELKLPQDYHAGNALKGALLVLQETTDKNGKPVLDVCTQESIASALLKMVVLGLSVIKKQCNFIAYGNKLQCDPEYTANVAMAKRYGMKSIYTHTIYKDDVFDYDVLPNGATVITKHKPSLAGIIKENIIGAYAVVTMEDGSTNATIMSLTQIKDAWNQGPMKGNSPAHKNFPDQMCEKTVSNRATKPIIRGSSDAALLFGDENEETEYNKSAVGTLERKKEASANAETISFDEVSPTTETPPTATTGFTDAEKAEIAKEEAEEIAKQTGK